MHITSGNNKPLILVINCTEIHFLSVVGKKWFGRYSVSLEAYVHIHDKPSAVLTTGLVRGRVRPGETGGTENPIIVASPLEVSAPINKAHALALFGRFLAELVRQHALS